MTEFVRGNLLEADVEALVDAVNCVGAMGKGIALHFKTALPDALRRVEVSWGAIEDAASKPPSSWVRTVARRRCANGSARKVSGRPLLARLSDPVLGESHCQRTRDRLLVERQSFLKVLG